VEGQSFTIKEFVQNDLKLAGSWSSPGGERKVFNGTSTDITLKWYGQKRKKLVIERNTEENLLANTLNSLYNKNNGGLDTTAASEGFVCGSERLTYKSTNKEKNSRGAPNSDFYYRE
jgi:hypothetical protein